MEKEKVAKEAQEPVLNLLQVKARVVAPSHQVWLGKAKVAPSRQVLGKEKAAPSHRVQGKEKVVQRHLAFAMKDYLGAVLGRPWLTLNLLCQQKNLVARA